MKDIIEKNINMRNITDKFSICLSMCCIMHCLALPILIVLLLFGGLIVLTQGTVFAPFIYTIF